MAKNSSPSRAPKNWRSTPGEPGGARKNGQKGRKPPSNRLAAINTAIKLMMKYCPDFQCEPARGSPRTPSRRKYEILPKARRLTHDCQIQARRNNPNFKCELGLRIGVHFHVENLEIHQKRGTCRCTYTGMSTTSQNTKNCTCGISTKSVAQLCPHKQHEQHLHCGNPVVDNGHPPCPKLDAKMNLHNRDIDHEEVLQLRDNAQFSSVWTKAAVVAQRRAWQRQCRCSTVQLWELGCLLHDCTEYCTTCKPKYRSPCQCTATEESLCF